jgi:tetratricopeptide (TPR) repeat protein
LALLGLLAAVPLVIARERAAADNARAETNDVRTTLDRERTRADCERWLWQGEAAWRRAGARTEDFKEARSLFTNARDRIRPQDAEEDEALRELRELAQRRLEALNLQVQARDAYQDVLRQRDRALFLLYGDVFLGTEGDGQKAWREGARDAARKALEHHGWPADLAGSMVRLPLEITEKETLRQGLFELCLILAEAEGPRPGQAPQESQQAAAKALEILDRAAALQPNQGVVQRRRARYLAVRGEPNATPPETSRPDGLPSRSSLDWFFEGCDRAFAEGQLPQGLACFDQALRLKSDLFWAHFFRAVVCHKLQRALEARASLTVCTVLQRDFPWTYLLRGSIAGQAGDFAAAADDFTRADKLLPAEDHSARYVLLVNRGFTALCQHDPQRAGQDLEEAVRLRPDLHAAYVNLANAYALREDYPQALRHLDRAVAIAAKDLQEVGAKAEPKVVDAQRARLASLYSTRAGILLKSRDSVGALRDLDAAVRLAPRAAPPRSVARDHRERSQILYKQRRYPQALVACEASLAILAEDAAAQRLHGDILLALACYQEAQAAFDRCVLLDNKHGDAELYRQRARARMGQRDARGAVEEYTRSLERADEPSTLAARGWAYLDAEAPRLALADFEAAIRRDPSQSDSFNGRALARVRLGDHNGTTDAELALRLGPPSWQRSYNAARVFSRAAALVEAGGQATAPQLAAHLRQRAVACLRDSLLLYPPRERAAQAAEVLSEPAFVPISDSPGFKRLREFASP